MGIPIGPLFITYYGMILMLGVVAAAFLADREARRRGQNTEIVWDGLIWVLIGGVLGARLWHVLTPSISMPDDITAGYYLTHPLDALAIWRGGLGIPGAILGGALALYIYTRRVGVSFGTWMDIVAPALALGQGIGRWGNYVNQELYGAPTDLPWAIEIDPQFRLTEYANQATYHPLFLYESLWNLANMVILLWLARRYAERLRTGDLFLVYLIIYPVGRFLLEFLRLDIAQVAGVNINQAVMAVVAIAAAGWLYWRHRTPASQAARTGRRRRSRSGADPQSD